jgi:hypothetical protein
LTFLGAKDSAANASGGAPYTGPVASGVVQWKALVDQSLTALGQPLTWEATVLRRMNQESGGNPNAINVTDSNAQAGDPSRGLMQTIMSTFLRWAPPGSTAADIYQPYANIYAGENYAIHEYGSLAGMNRPGGYDEGGWLPPGLWNGTRKPEPVLTSAQWDKVKPRTIGHDGGSTHNYYITSDDPVSVAHEIERRETANMRAKL